MLPAERNTLLKLLNKKQKAETALLKELQKVFPLHRTIEFADVEGLTYQGKVIGWTPDGYIAVMCHNRKRHVRFYHVTGILEDAP